MSMTARAPLVLVVALLGCDSAPDRPTRGPPHPPAQGASAAPLSSASNAPGAPLAVTGEVASAASSGLSPGTPGDTAGAWEGGYDAKKGTLTLPSKVKDKALAADDGKTAAGRGTVDLVVLANGDVRGKMSGALGAATISGKLDGEMIRTVIRPDDPLSPAAMTGILVGKRKGDAIACQIHVAGPDGTVIRESTVDLTRKK